MIIKAFQIADSLDLKRLKDSYTGELLSFSSLDLFYKSDNKYLYITSYGVAVFCEYDDLKISESINFLKNYATNILAEKISDEYIVLKSDSGNVFGHNEAALSIISDSSIKIAMLNISQSVSLDYYQMHGNQMINETNYYTQILEKKGRLLISKKKLLKFIGKTLNVKNSIFDQLYIFDQPEVTWNDEYLSEVDKGLKQLFDIKNRFRNLDYTLKIINENLDLFKDLLQHAKSNLLEIIIIVLIMVEVGNMFLEKIF
ncbi:MAG: RMD1 family protein [Bacteroidales bacterium]|nr:RMD1 family protein [Bacteroidales bacterium]